MYENVFASESHEALLEEDGDGESLPHTVQGQDPYSRARKLLKEWRSRTALESPYSVIICLLLFMLFILLLSTALARRFKFTSIKPHSAETLPAFPSLQALQFSETDVLNHEEFPKEFLGDPPIPFILQSLGDPSHTNYEWTESQQNNVLSYLSTSRSMIRKQQPPVCDLTAWHIERYTPIIRSRSRIYLALNLHNNENIIPVFMQSFTTLFPLLGTTRIFVSIFESGSTDKTPTLLRLLAKLLDSLDVRYRIESRGETEISDISGGKRIMVLADVRNAALQYLYDSPPGTYDTVLFMSDVIHCPADVLEVLYQHWFQGADMSCSMDRQDWIIYDRWVLRSMNGHPYYEHEDLAEYEHNRNSPPPILPNLEDEEERKRFMAYRPTQVFSCWNGMAAIDARAFYEPIGIRFRQAVNRPHPTDLASECFLLTVDLWRAKMNKIQVVPRASVSYWPKWYRKWRHDNKNMNLSSIEEQKREMIMWKLEPPEKVGFQDSAQYLGPETKAIAMGTMGRSLMTPASFSGTGSMLAMTFDRFSSSAILLAFHSLYISSPADAGGF